MNPLHRSTPEDAAGLQMENNLLTHEIRHLRSRLRSVLRQLRDLQAVDESGAPVSLADMRQAHEDMQHLIARLDSSGLGPVLRRRPGFKVLIDRYTRGDD